MRKSDTTRVVVVGGGAAGWLAAGIIAAKNPGTQGTGATQVTLIESPGLKNLGVGEGTWPTMRDTLRNIGISERQFLSCCHASFKQASKFVGWQHGKGEHYYHPFTAPAGYGVINLAEAWHEQGCPGDFESWVCAQGTACEHNLAPKLPELPEYAYNFNYGYHLSADKFVELLHDHCTNKLNVEYLSAHVAGINSHPSGAIASIALAEGGVVEGDLFVDCTGFQSLLLRQHYNVPYVSRRDVLFNDCAMAGQVHHASDDTPISSSTVATAQSYGWMWDIALTGRRGIGHVFASQYATDAQAEDTLRSYVAQDPHLQQGAFEPRVFRFEPGHLGRFWEHNCVAIGISAGFVEPLEATSLVLIEKSAEWIAAQLPRTPAAMAILARRFNTLTRERWDEIVDFIKLHYVLSERRDSEYWRAHVDPSSWTDTLKDSLALWKSQPPGLLESNVKHELFSSASKQYVLYGMGFRSTDWQAGEALTRQKALIERIRRESRQTGENLVSRLPSNRDYLNRLRTR
jgi:glycine/D-amino acid oxidase-like deaminating enzyme|tara:strand:+ start:210 stop:1757 length:1548 start_codon:yes stop_codon:yes gene_type:complete